MSRWSHLYPAHVDAELPAPDTTLDRAWSERCARDPQSATLRYFDTVFTAEQTDAMAEALAADFAARGVGRGGIVGIQLQNIPQFAVAFLALWKLGATALVLNPMYRNVELRDILTDARPVGVIGLGGEPEATVRAIQSETCGGWYLPTSEEGMHRLGAGEELDELCAILDAGLSGSPTPVPPPEIGPGDPALLTYTSGTTGPPKGAIGTHANLLNTAHATANWLDVRPGDRVLAVAPLFHITGAVGTAAMSLVGDAELVFIGRLEAQRFLDAIRDYGIHHILGSITVYHALLDLPSGGREDTASLRTVFSGGAPVPPATVRRFEERFGHYIRNVYGMTETASAIIGVPMGQHAPIDEASGTLAIGVPFPGTDARVRSSGGELAAAGEIGELEVSGASCTPGYLDRPEATAATVVEGWVRTGDVALIGDDGWIYLVDRLKDQINVSGYKVWPREVEDVLYQHPAVREAAVRSRPHPYKGEEVVAFVSVVSGAEAELDADELRGFVREQLAAYKCPAEVFVIPELPKTATGKIQRRALDGEAGTVTEV